MTLPPGTHLGPYALLGPLGKGGMGEVYRAQDTRLPRQVAIKVLPPDVSNDPDRLRRFEREVRAASSLNHPHIIVVHDIGRADSIAYMAMELIEGDTLRSRLAAGPLPIRRALEFGTQIAAALATAHEAGIAHRDLKPSNVMISREGFIKVLDFGLAKFDERRTPAGESEITKSGTLLGTVEYMAPEQAGGDPTDFRVDQFALGILLYEMTTAVNPFARATQAETLAAILRDEPAPIHIVRPGVPAPLQWIIDRCLAKHPGERFASTRDLARDLEGLRDHLSELENKPAPKANRGIALAAILALVVAVAAAARGWLRDPQLSSPTLRFSVYPPTGSPFNFETVSPAPASLSQDGRVLVFGARDPSGQNILWLRSLDSTEDRPLPGTQGATYPFWSPDGRFIAFFADGKLKRIASAGGLAESISDAPQGRGGTWGNSDLIIFAPDNNGPLVVVPAAGGSPRPITAAAPNVSHRWPCFLPDGRHYLYTARATQTPAPGYEIRLGAIGSSDTQVLLAESSQAAYAAPGYVVFARAGTLFAVPFDVARLRLQGTPIPITDGVRYHRYRLNAHFTASAGADVLAYETQLRPDLSEVAWFDRTGRRVSTLLEPADYGGVRLSPDGRRAAVEVREMRTGKLDIWLADLAQRVRMRLTYGNASNDSPIWSPDGMRLAYTSNHSGHWDLYETNASGSGPEEVLLQSSSDKLPTDWSADGRFIVFSQAHDPASGNSDIFVLPVHGAPPFPVVETPFNERDGRVSKDGRWIAYASDESGDFEVYVSPFPHPTAKWRVSTRGGRQPVWGRSANELIYLGPNDALMVAHLRIGSGIDVMPPSSLFDAHLAPSSSDIPLFDVSAESRLVLMVTSPAQDRPAGPLTVALNWTAALHR